ncbi:actin-like ATPase domain-containing protein [Phlegmacium glaucopus]|nr:actin-like ATPase domain-containing protein [Phlegmacium glaucopus]
MSTNPLFLGLDLSTQRLKAILLSQDSVIVHEASIHFDRDLPHYGTVNGAIRGPDPGEVTSPVEMWLEAIDLLFQRLKADQVDFGAIAAISGAGQQHGSVYWSNKAASCLSNLDSNETLVGQLVPAAFSLAKAPIWQDSSTSEDCSRLEEIFGGAQALADCTGSRAYERFTGNQIARVSPVLALLRVYLSLVSSFIPSLFLGTIAPIEISDASGMNLMDVLTCKWDDRLLSICGGPTLRSKLGPEPISGGTTLGTVSDWWVNYWGFRPTCIVAPFTGDNPATVVSLSAPGDALLSLGTSTTFLLSIPTSTIPPKRMTTSHLLSHPTDPEGKIAMLCYKNGALAREHIRDRFASGDWNVFNILVEQCPPGCNGYMGFYFPFPEIIPPGVVGEYFFATQLTDQSSKTPLPVKDIPASVHPRAIIESQLLSIRSRIAAILPNNSPPLKRLVITGGSSTNETISQMIADIFGMDVYVSATKEAAGLGGALLAKYAWWKQSNAGKSFEDMGDGTIGLKCVAKPRLEIRKVYDTLVSVYDTLEKQVASTWASQSMV